MTPCWTCPNGLANAFRWSLRKGTCAETVEGGDCRMVKPGVWEVAVGFCGCGCIANAYRVLSNCRSESQQHFLILHPRARTSVHIYIPWVHWHFLWICSRAVSMKPEQIEAVQILRGVSPFRVI